ncbi:unnamed protein product [Durusdinium trenchii]|uniref:Major facilitator superfamily (MFS) profile domain-containing protein n=1 Tax=Durusdinium trenchii TaxID=1381693 RepID=A0ABP0KCM0_9DINO
METEETPLVKEQATRHGNSNMLPLVLISSLYCCSGAYTTATVFTGSFIALEPGFSENWVHMGQTMLWIGVAAATATLLPLLDIYGRRDLLFAFGFVGLLAVVTSLLAVSPFVYLACQFGIGLFLFPTGLAAWVLVAESIPQRSHNRMMAIWNVCYSLFGITVASGSYGFKEISLSWQLQSAVWYLPIVLSLLIGPSVVSESPELLADRSGQAERSDQSLMVWPMPGYVLATVVCWSAVSMGFYALSYSSSSLSPDLYLNMGLLACMDAVVYAFSKPVIDALSPKWAQFAGLSGCAALMLVSSFLPGKSYAMMFMCLLARMFLDVAFSTIFLLIIEVFPVPVRATAMGIANLVARSFTAVAPVLAMAPAWIACWVVVMATAAAALATWTLPEQVSIT